METSHFEERVSVDPAPTADEVAAILAAIAQHRDQAETTDEEAVADHSLWRLQARYPAIRRDRPWLESDRDRWSVAHRLDR